MTQSTVSTPMLSLRGSLTGRQRSYASLSPVQVDSSGPTLPGGWSQRATISSPPTGRRMSTWVRTCSAMSSTWSICVSWIIAWRSLLESTMCSIWPLTWAAWVLSSLITLLLCITTPWLVSTCLRLPGLTALRGLHSWKIN